MSEDLDITLISRWICVFQVYPPPTRPEPWSWKLSSTSNNRRRQTVEQRGVLAALALGAHVGSVSGGEVIDQVVLLQQVQVVAAGPAPRPAASSGALTQRKGTHHMNDEHHVTRSCRDSWRGGGSGPVRRGSTRREGCPLDNDNNDNAYMTP